MLAKRQLHKRRYVQRTPKLLTTRPDAKSNRQDGKAGEGQTLCNYWSADVTSREKEKRRGGGVVIGLFGLEYRWDQGIPSGAVTNVMGFDEPYEERELNDGTAMMGSIVIPSDERRAGEIAVGEA